VSEPTRRGLRLGSFGGPAIAAVVFFALAWAEPLWTAVFGALFPGEARVLYQQATLWELTWETIVMVAISSVLSISIGLGLGIFVTRRVGRDFFYVVSDLANLSQTFPPIAVFTLAVPLLGFGFAPTILALTIYGILPVLHNTISGLDGLPPDVIESAQGQGMTALQRLVRVELPLAAPVILAGVRTSVVINVATSTIGAIAGAGGLGAPIISGINNDDPAVTLEGAIMAAYLALLIDAVLGRVERAAAVQAHVRA
jgi:osmoprotectant transport system permease protein